VAFLDYNQAFELTGLGADPWYAYTAVGTAYHHGYVRGIKGKKAKKRRKKAEHAKRAREEAAYKEMRRAQEERLRSMKEEQRVRGRLVEGLTEIRESLLKSMTWVKRKGVLSFRLAEIKGYPSDTAWHRELAGAAACFQSGAEAAVAGTSSGLTSTSVIRSTLESSSGAMDQLRDYLRKIKKLVKVIEEAPYNTQGSQGVLLYDQEQDD
jgi:hypothetical protein